MDEGIDSSSRYEGSLSMPLKIVAKNLYSKERVKITVWMIFSNLLLEGHFRIKFRVYERISNESI